MLKEPRTGWVERLACQSSEYDAGRRFAGYGTSVTQLSDIFIIIVPARIGGDPEVLRTDRDH